MDAVVGTLKFENKAVIPTDPRTKLFLTVTVSTIMITGGTGGFMNLVRPCLMACPIVFLLLSRKWRAAARFAVTYAILFTLELTVGPLMNFTTYVNETKTVEYAVHDVDKLLHVEELPDTGKPVEVQSKDIQLQDVSFSYDKESGKQVLSHINLKIPEGKFTALVGPSGGGKSTIARLIARFWDVNDGKITIGGVDIRSMPLAQLADIVSFVTQDNFLFNCSIKENIRLGNPDATDEEVYAAAKAACCDEFIQKLDNGYDTMAGDAGNRLSGGEKQRISIARMILKNAPIVILDEATAFTDQENEEKIQQSIAALTKGKTLLVIAHRLSTIKNADQIIVLQNGQVENTGTHQQLLDGDALYRDMWEAHIGAQNWSAGSGKGGN